LIFAKFGKDLFNISTGRKPKWPRFFGLPCTFQQCIDYIVITWHASARRVKGWVEKTSYFELNASISWNRYVIRPQLPLMTNALSIGIKISVLELP